MGIVDDLSHSNTWWEIFRTGFNPIPGIFLPQQSYAFHSPSILYLTLIQPHLLPLKQENLIIFHKCGTFVSKFPYETFFSHLSNEESLRLPQMGVIGERFWIQANEKAG